ncbi:translation initiation factor IF-2 [Fusibacter paucivorans]|uniref:Translation initiation factor IF-2 n=1 Tax=Fusibacter paucivorans TaxID=76009 RepID=A0ABS5PS67_9FIRM|nr:translation initiation factor IF-2 [Fusibacter paucivorans]MBS7528008.1 translation initiation factor IF-2 [Fusibacter paucivorans]
MSKVRIHELAKTLNKSSKDLIDAASSLGMNVKNHMSTLEDNEVAKLKQTFKPAPEKSHNKIIYDRTKEVKQEERQSRNNDNRSRNQGDRPQRSNDNRSQNQGDRPQRNYDNRSQNQGDRPQRNYDNRSQSQGDRPQRNYDNRNQGDRPQRSYDNRNQGDRPQRSYDNRNQGDRPQRSYDNRNQGDRPQRSYDNRNQGDRPQRSYDNRNQGDRSQRSYDNRNQGDRPQRSYDNRNQGDRPQRSYDNRNQGDRPQRSYDNRNQGNSGRPPRSYDNRGGGYNKDKDGDQRPAYQQKKRTEPKKDTFASEIAEKTPSKKKRTKKDKIVVTFETDKLDKKSKKAKRPVKDAGSNTNERRGAFDFTKKTKQKKLKYQKASEKERSEKLDEILQKEVVTIPEKITVKELAEIINKNPNEVIMKLMDSGIMATINQDVEYDTAALIAADYNISLELEEVEEIDLAEVYELNAEDDPSTLVKRAPVVTVMGHVDHGKTSLLDAIRNTGVAVGEAGGITQHIGASEIMHRNEKIVFLDTPGHEAFTSLRARGAKITDIAILVVAADDGVMPQTIEAIDHSKAAGVPIIVAINKIDKPNANPDRVKQELSEKGVIIEEWGGDVIAVPVSAKTGEGLETLLEMVLLVAEVLELKANPDRPGVGTVIEAKVVKGRGTVASIILEKGTLTVGDPVVAGITYGKVKALYNDKGKKVKRIGPSTSVEIDGLAEVPQAGEKIYVTPDEKTARYIAEKNAITFREKSLNKNVGITLEDLFSKIKEGEIKELNIIIKADVHGSVEAIKQSLLKLSNEEVRVNIIHANVGAISESDVTLASASSAIIIGFNVRPSSNVQYLAEQEGVDIRTYRIIYDAINDVEAAMTGMLDPTFKEVILGRIQVRATFKVPSVGTIAGGYVTNGKVTRNAQVRLIREGIVVFEGKIASLKRFKDDVKEVAQGYECGIGLESYNDLQEMDEIEAFVMEEVKREGLK